VSLNISDLAISAVNLPNSAKSVRFAYNDGIPIVFGVISRFGKKSEYLFGLAGTEPQRLMGISIRLMGLSAYPQDKTEFFRVHCQL